MSPDDYTRAADVIAARYGGRLRFSQSRKVGWFLHDDNPDTPVQPLPAGEINREARRVLTSGAFPAKGSYRELDTVLSVLRKRTRVRLDGFAFDSSGAVYVRHS